MSGPVAVTGFADEIAAHAGEQIAGLQSARVSFLELRGVNGTNVLDLTDAEVEEFRGQLGDAGIRVSCIGSPIGKVQIRADLEEHFARFQVALQRADQFDCRFVRLFSFYHEAEEPAAVRDLVVAQLQRMAAAATEAGVTLVHENEKGIYGDTPERCLDLLTTVGSEHLKAAFDPANFVQCGADSMQSWDLLASHVIYFHIKDAVADSGRVVPAGLGDGDVEQVLAAALNRGFSGFLSIEPHLKEQDPDYGGGGVERFTLATTALRAILHRLGADETDR
ncbi:MAG TPA: sugar phosphate isomerase/epimerase family protein [Candidatus Latescibacteria bacterium]|nr:sugar phosphate isomerase/epimerase family protein [Candidatus Latescibacterota bacterium]HJP33231.1 sugar phosphate isomerase/epimerase family protein [Candidatus Latescibacterota bacterium]